VVGRSDFSAALVLAFYSGAAAFSYFLARRNYYQSAAWLLIYALIVMLALVFFRTSYSVSILITFMLPIAMVSVLLSIRATIVTMIVCIITTFLLYFGRDVTHWYVPTVGADSSTAFATNVFLIILVIPVLTSLMALPARAQNNALKQQNERLAEAFADLQARQFISQIVSQSVLGLAADLKLTASQQASSSQEQAAAVMQVEKSVNSLSTATEQIKGFADEVTSASQAMSANSQEIKTTTNLAVLQGAQGIEVVAHTITTSQEVADLYNELTAILNTLQQQSSSTQRILELLDNITQETHLLSLNAAIEAAGAGDYGVRFGVVAQEVKDLASRASRANQEVVQVLQQIEQTISSSVVLVEAGYQKAQAMKVAVGETGQVIADMRQISEQAQTQAEQILQVTQQVKELTEVIRLATNQQHGVSTQVLTTLNELASVAERNAEDSIQVSATVVELQAVSQQLAASLAADNKATVL
jgi:methyl-accepting chemotaxis protein